MQRISTGVQPGAIAGWFPRFSNSEAIRGLAGLLGLLDVKASISIHELLGITPPVRSRPPWESRCCRIGSGCLFWVCQKT